MTEEFNINKIDLISKSITTKQFSSNNIFSNSMIASTIISNNLHANGTTTIFGNININESVLFEEAIIISLTVDDLIVNNIPDLEVGDFTTLNINSIDSFKTESFGITPISSANIANITFNSYKIGNLCYFNVSFDVTPLSIGTGPRRSLGQIDDSDNFPIERFTISILNVPTSLPQFPLRIGETGLIDFQLTSGLVAGGPYFGGGAYLINS
jgi:hypothetical protein